MSDRHHERIEALRDALGARAAGLWRAEGDRLQQLAFAAVADMPEEVARSFAEATRSVPLGQGNLGIVRAYATGVPAISRIEELPPDHGSGLWLRRFEAARSIAVPVEGGQVVSIATAERTQPDEAIAERLRDAARRWAEADA